MTLFSLKAFQLIAEGIEQETINYYNGPGKPTDGKTKRKKKKHIIYSKLDPEAEIRNRGAVVFPANSKKVKDNKDHFPINDANQARNALSRVSQYNSVPPWYSGSLEELKMAVRSAVKRKYKNIEVTDPKSKGTYSKAAFLLIARKK